MVLSFTHPKEFKSRLRRNDPKDGDSHLVLDSKMLSQMMNKLDFASEFYMDLAQAVRKNRTVKKLTLCQCQETHAPLEDLLVKLSNLKAISCFDCSATSVRRLLKRATKVRELQILFKNPTPDDLSVVAAGIRKHPSLREINFHCQWPDGAKESLTDNVDVVVMAMATVPCLQLVHFGSTTADLKFRFSHSTSLRKLLQHPALQQLYLVRYILSYEDCEVLAAALKEEDCPLKVLHLVDMSFDRPDDAIAIANALQANASVSDLCLDRLHHAPVEFYHALALALRGNKSTLTRLSLDEQRLVASDDHGEWLYEILGILESGSTSLQTMSITGNGISDKMGQTMSEVLRANNNNDQHRNGLTTTATGRNARVVTPGRTTTRHDAAANNDDSSRSRSTAGSQLSDLVREASPPPQARRHRSEPAVPKSIVPVRARSVSPLGRRRGRKNSNQQQQQPAAATNTATRRGRSPSPSTGGRSHASYSSDEEMILLDIPESYHTEKKPYNYNNNATVVAQNLYGMTLLTPAENIGGGDHPPAGQKGGASSVAKNDRREQQQGPDSMIHRVAGRIPHDDPESDYEITGSPIKRRPSAEQNNLEGSAASLDVNSLHNTHSIDSSNDASSPSQMCDSSINSLANMETHHVGHGCSNSQRAPLEAHPQENPKVSPARQGSGSKRRSSVTAYNLGESGFPSPSLPGSSNDERKLANEHSLVSPLSTSSNHQRRGSPSKRRSSVTAHNLDFGVVVSPGGSSMSHSESNDGHGHPTGSASPNSTSRNVGAATKCPGSPKSNHARRGPSPKRRTSVTAHNLDGSITSLGLRESSHDERQVDDSPKSAYSRSSGGFAKRRSSVTVHNLEGSLTSLGSLNEGGGAYAENADVPTNDASRNSSSPTYLASPNNNTNQARQGYSSTKRRSSVTAHNLNGSSIPSLDHLGNNSNHSDRRKLVVDDGSLCSSGSNELRRRFTARGMPPPGVAAAHQKQKGGDNDKLSTNSASHAAVVHDMSDLTEVTQDLSDSSHRTAESSSAARQEAFVRSQSVPKLSKTIALDRILANNTSVPKSPSKLAALRRKCVDRAKAVREVLTGSPRGYMKPPFHAASENDSYHVPVNNSQRTDSSQSLPLSLVQDKSFDVSDQAPAVVPSDKKPSSTDAAESFSGPELLDGSSDIVEQVQDNFSDDDDDDESHRGNVPSPFRAAACCYDASEKSDYHHLNESSDVLPHDEETSERPTLNKRFSTSEETLVTNNITGVHHQSETMNPRRASRRPNNSGNNNNNIPRSPPPKQSSGGPSSKLDELRRRRDNKARMMKDAIAVSQRNLFSATSQEEDVVAAQDKDDNGTVTC